MTPILHIPTCLGAVVIAYNLPGRSRLRFTPSLVADIFLGKITKWTDNRIRALNPELRLPEMDIVGFHRSEGSGTTFIFTDYLSKVSDLWKRQVGKGKAANWRTGLGSKGNPGVAGLIKYFPGSLGYLELGYALLNNIPVAGLQNRAGRFIEPGAMATSMAGNVSLPEDTRISLTDTDAPNGYAISSFTWLLIFKEQAYGRRSMQRAKVLAKVLWWIIHDAQKYADPLHYAPLPAGAVHRAEKIIKSMTYHGDPIFDEAP